MPKLHQAGRSSAAHLRENLKAADLKLDAKSPRTPTLINSRPTPALSRAVQL